MAGVEFCNACQVIFCKNNGRGTRYIHPVSQGRHPAVEEQIKNIKPIECVGLIEECSLMKANQSLVVNMVTAIGWGALFEVWYQEKNHPILYSGEDDLDFPH